MSVLANNRKESRYEPIMLSVKIHEMLTELAQRNYGIKDLNHFVRMRYENIENMFKSWMGSFYKLMTRKQREGLISLYETLFNKTITIINKKMVITDLE